MQDDNKPISSPETAPTQDTHSIDPLGQSQQINTAQSNQPVISSQVDQSQTSTPTGGGMKVIQPTGNAITPESPDTSQVVVGSQPAEVSHTPTSTVANPTIPQSIYPQPQTGLSRSEIEAAIAKEKRKKRIIKTLLIAPVFLIIVGVAAFVLATNQNIRATIFRQKFVTYNYPLCKTHICTIKFYRGSKIASYTPTPPPGQTPLPASTDLISPVLDGKTYLSMRINAFSSSAASTPGGKKFLDTYDNCSSPGETSGFTEYLSNLGVNDTVCGVSANPSDPSYILGYTTAFTSSKDGVFCLVIINENVNLNSQEQPTTATFNLANYQSDIESVLASLNFKNK